MSNGQQPARPRMPLVPSPPGTMVRSETAGLTQHTPANIAIGHGDMGPGRGVVGPRPIGKVTKAVANVMKEVGTIKKRGTNEFFNYKYATFDDLLYAVTPLMGEQGLAVTQTELHMGQEKQYLTVKYEFVMYHESGESLPPQVFTGMSLLLTRKGTYDDKAINKCHSTARKYFLLSQFQVPAGDFEDGDGDVPQQAVPSPGVNASAALASGGGATMTGGGGGGGGSAKQPAPARGAISQAAKSAPEQATPSAPQRLTLPPGTTAEAWAAAYIRAIGEAKSELEIKDWDTLNDDFLQRISDRHSAIYDSIAAAVERRLSEVSGPTGAFAVMPDPKKDAQEAMNWVAMQLQQLNTIEAAEEFWNGMVAPHEKEFEVLDWEMLMAEWQRTETRLAAPPADTQ